MNSPNGRLEPVPVIDLTSTDVAATPLDAATIFFGSQSGTVCLIVKFVIIGTAEAFAQMIKDSLRSHGLRSTVSDLETFEPGSFWYAAKANLCPNSV
jgi:hypothetical protein